ncbi:MAG: helix-turn-helix transcriptional regulator [Ruthenibacterium sp.]
MYEIDNAAFGIFVAELRKEKGMTQKELAQKLYVSDKAVSKWERGLSLPDIALLVPLSGVFGITVTELLAGKRLRESAQMDMQTVEKLVTGTLSLSAQQKKEQQTRRLRSGIVFAVCALVASIETAILLSNNAFDAVPHQNIFVMEGMLLLFGAWFCFFAKETLPPYYDSNKISSFSDGVFRMNLAGVHFNNRNWPFILRAGRMGTLGGAVAIPLLYLISTQFFSPATGEFLHQWSTFFVLAIIFVPLIIAAKRHE